MKETIQILHTNDLHSHLENWPKIRRYLQAEQAEAIAQKRTNLTVDLGDFNDRVHPLTEATDGAIGIQLLNSAGYDAVTIGNNEGIGNAHQVLEHLYDEAEFQVVLANLRESDTGAYPAFAQPYWLTTTEAGTRIAFIGLTAVFPLTYGPNGWKIEEIDQTLEALLVEVKPLADIIILLSHLGITDDRRLAQRFPELTIIIGAHTHHLFEQGEWQGQTLLAAAGKYGYYVGKITIEVVDHRVIAAEASVVATSQLPELLEDQAEIEHYLLEGERLLAQEQIAELPETYFYEPQKSPQISDLGLAAVRQAANVDVAFLNTGLFLTDLAAGPVSRKQIQECLPHPMRLIRVKLDGTNLVRLIREMVKNQPFLRQFPIKGMGFRGKVFGSVVATGIRYDEATQWAYLEATQAAVVRDQVYEIVTVDHFLFIPFFPTIELAGEVEFLFPDFIRTILQNYLREIYPISRNQLIIEDETSEEAN